MNRIIIQEKNLKTSIFNIVIFLFGTLLLLNSCTIKPINELSKKINISLRSSNEIDENEWNEFIEYIIGNKKDLPNLIGKNDTVNSIKLIELILSVANKRRGDIQEPKIFKPDVECEKAKIKVFIENSGSMDGYVRNTTEFKVALTELLVRIQHKYGEENLNMNFINTKIHPSQVNNVGNFVKKLKPSKPPYNTGGERSVSKLNEILGIMIDSTAQDNISILISDCIYSLDSGEALELQKSLTKNVFLQKSKEFDFSTIVLKMSSKFNGYYYDKNNGKTYLNNKSRPYYIWIIGKGNLISLFSKNIEPSSLAGFKSKYFLSNSTKNNQPFYTVLKKTNKIGGFKLKNNKIIDIKYDGGNGRLQFSIAIDLNNILVDQAYLTNAENYNLTSGFSIESIEKVDKSKCHLSDWLTIKNITANYIITVLTTSKYPIQDLQLELSNKIPSWVSESNSIDDIDITNQLDKTFGLLYLIQGVSEAYTFKKPNNKSYFKINIPIKKR